MSDPNRNPGEGDDPFAELDEDDDSFEDPIEETDDSPEDPFEEMDDEGEPIEDVWETLGEEGTAGESTLAPVRGTDELEENVVDKRSFCQRCRYLSAPPAVECTHEGTEILEVVDSDRFRVRGCPMVERGGPESTTR